MPTIPAKKKAKLKSRMATKSKTLAKKPVARAQAKKRPAAVKAQVTPISDRLDRRVHTDSREYDRRVFVRFDGITKELVKKAAGSAGLSPYIAHFAAVAAKAGRKTPSDIYGTLANRDAGVFARFENPSVKQLVKKMADASGVSLSAYAAHFALEAATAGKSMPSAEKAVAKAVAAS
jgi:hypothetical protein